MSITPEHSKPNVNRLWVCEECGKVLSDEEMRRDAATGQWGRPCKGKMRCEAFFRAYLPEEASCQE